MYHQSDFNEYGSIRKKMRYRNGVILILAVLSIAGAIKWGFFSENIEITNDDRTMWEKVANFITFGKVSDKESADYAKNYVMPKKEKNRLDVLILGLRGKDTPDEDETGALLTDTMLVFSYDKDTQKSSLISIPRDLYVIIRKGKKDKINAAYETGLLGKEDLGLVKNLVSEVTGVYIDNAVVIDFSSFKKIVDDLGGIDVELAKPFSEKQQWGYEFSLPAGKNHLDGDKALYFVRSRYSSSDFDRSQRQQQVIAAVKDKLLALNFINDPIKTISLINTLRSNIKTDFNIWDVADILSLAKEVNSSSSKMKHYIMSTENLLYEGHLDNIYILLPKGDNFDGIKKIFQDSLK